jgi:hypothetical protein
MERVASESVEDEEYAIIDLEAEARLAREKVPLGSFRKSRELISKRRRENRRLQSC